MSSYKKYVMMGVSTLLLPLARRIIKKLASKYTEEPEDDSAVEESEDFVPASQMADRRT